MEYLLSSDSSVPSPTFMKTSSIVVMEIPNPAIPRSAFRAGERGGRGWGEGGETEREREGGKERKRERERERERRKERETTVTHYNMHHSWHTFQGVKQLRKRVGGV